MKIAINITREQLGGITVSNLNLIKHLYKDNIQISGIELNSRRRMGGSALYRIFDPTLFSHNIVNMHDIDLVRAIKKSKTIKDLEKQFEEIIKIVCDIIEDEGPDVIVISGTYSLPWIISIAAHKMKVPIVLWYSGVLPKEIEGYSPEEKKIFVEMEKSVVKRASKIIFPSQLCKSTVEKIVTRKPISTEAFIIPNPVSYDFINETAVNYSVANNIAAVGRYTRIKNLDKFFDLHLRLKKSKWEHECNLVTNTQRKYIKNLPATVNTLPPMDTLGLKRFYLSQGLIVSTSTFETFGNVPMEAVVMGIPVLVSKNMGCAEILKRAGLSNMVIDFDDEKLVDERVKELCGQSIMPNQINALRKMLDPELIHEEIKSVIVSCVN